MEQVILKDLGQISYLQGWDLQQHLFDEVVEKKLQRREKEVEHKNGLHYLLLCEHPPVFTLGRNGSEEHLLADPGRLSELGIEYYKINRGGDITFHGPGQIVGYPILDLDCLFTDIGRYLRNIEEVIIQVLKEYGLEGQRLPGATGVWLDPQNPFRARKICAIGIRASRWVTMHGFAFNVNTDLDYFKQIIPCGIDDKQVTSLHQELGKQLDITEVTGKITAAFESVFEVQLVKK